MVGVHWPALVCVYSRRPVDEARYDPEPRDHARRRPRISLHAIDKPILAIHTHVDLTPYAGVHEYGVFNLSGPMGFPHFPRENALVTVVTSVRVFEQAHNRALIKPTCPIQRCSASATFEIDIGAGIDQHLGELDMANRRRPNEEAQRSSLIILSILFMILIADEPEIRLTTATSARRPHCTLPNPSGGKVRLK